MGLLDNTSEQAYYLNFQEEFPNAWGGYRFVTLDNIINAFMITHVGEGKIISKVNRTDVQFHGMRAIQELSYDVFRSIKSQEVEVQQGSLILPQDYVNYIKLTRMGSDGIERVLYPTGKTSNPVQVHQDSDGIWQFNDDGSIKFTETEGLFTTLSNTHSDTLAAWQGQGSNQSSNDDDVDGIEVSNQGRRYGLDPQHAQSNGTFFIDELKGIIFFSSNLMGETITLRYVSDGLGTDNEMVVHKFCEEAVYKWIAYGILATKSNIPEYIVQRYKKERFAETRKAKIRLSNIKIEEFTQVLKGMGKQIK